MANTYFLYSISETIWNRKCLYLSSSQLSSKSPFSVYYYKSNPCSFLGLPYGVVDGENHQMIVLNVNGEAVTITVASGEDLFKGFLMECQKMLDSMKWLKEYVLPRVLDRGVIPSPLE
jgi:hypothetical protein